MITSPVTGMNKAYRAQQEQPKDLGFEMDMYRMGVVGRVIRKPCMRQMAQEAHVGSPGHA